MRRFSGLLLTILLACFALSVAAAEVPVPPSPHQWVTDTAGFLSPGTAQALNARLRAFDKATGDQVIVYIGQSTGDTPLEDWCVKAFKKWAVGQKGKDNGLVIFIMARDQKIHIEVGYGLEGTVPDVIAFRIIQEIMLPRIRAGDRDGAVTAGVDAVLQTINPKVAAATKGASPAPAPVVRTKRSISLGQIILFVILGIGFLILLATNPSLALFLLFSILSGGRGGGMGGGGGFSGGGGSSGGGGASGGW
jgi:uncharacterized protein